MAEEIGDRHDEVGETEGLSGHVDVDLPKNYDTHAGSVSSAVTEDTTTNHRREH